MRYLFWVDNYLNSCKSYDADIFLPIIEKKSSKKFEINRKYRIPLRFACLPIFALGLYGATWYGPLENKDTKRAALRAALFTCLPQGGSFGNRV